jgi:molybdopterin converting factor subunit 1
VRVKVKLFGAPREALGRREIEQTLPEGSTAGHLLDLLVEAYPALITYSSTIKLAVNRRYAPPQTPLREGDEVALIPPVGGG